MLYFEPKILSQIAWLNPLFSPLTGPRTRNLFLAFRPNHGFRLTCHRHLSTRAQNFPRIHHFFSTKNLIFFHGKSTIGMFLSWRSNTFLPNVPPRHQTTWYQNTYSSPSLDTEQFSCNYTKQVMESVGY